MSIYVYKLLNIFLKLEEKEEMKTTFEKSYKDFEGCMLTFTFS